jgi:hypothetical protein
MTKLLFAFFPPLFIAPICFLMLLSYYTILLSQPYNHNKQKLHNEHRNSSFNALTAFNHFFLEYMPSKAFTDQGCSSICWGLLKDKEKFLENKISLERIAS